MRVVKKIKKFIKKINLAKEYDKKLINELSKEHKDLFELVNNIQTNIKQQNYNKTKKLLKHLQIELLEHIMFEDEYFYPYLKTKYKYIPDTLTMIESKQKEMLQITEVIKNFVNLYSDTDKLKSENFNKDLEQIVNALVKRVNFEEEVLYSYY